METKQKTAHAPGPTRGPWTAIKDGNNMAIGLLEKNEYYDGLGLVVAKTIGNSPMCRANAEFIVRACNCHDDLLGVLQFTADWLANKASLPRGCESMESYIRAAIAKAEGNAS